MSDFNTNSGALFNNDKKSNPKQPALKGSMNFDGKDHWAAAWRKVSSESGKAYISIALQEKDVEDAPTINAELYPIQNPKSERAPTFDGTIRVSEDRELNIVAWVKTASTTGKTFYSIKVSEMEEQSAGGDKIDEGDIFFGMGSSQQQAAPQPKQVPDIDAGWDEDIPF